MEFLIFLQNLRKRWLFLLLFSLVPSLSYGLLVYYSPRTYRTTIHYQIPLTALTLEILQERFYSGSNLDLILGHLKEEGAVEIPFLIESAESEADLRAIFDLSATPEYIDFKRRANLKLSLERSWAENVEKLEKLHAQLVKITIQAAPRDEVVALARWLRHNFSQELTLYEARDDLTNRMNKLAKEIGQYEHDRAYAVLARTNAAEILEKLKTIPGITTRNDTGYQLNLNFQNLDNQGRFLPLDLQVQAYSAEVIRLAQVIHTGDQRREMQRQIYATLRGLIEKIDGGGGETSSLDVYREFVKQTQDTCGQTEVSEQLASHLTWIDNLKLVRSSLTALSRVQPLARGTVKLTILTALVLLMVGIAMVSLADLDRRSMLQVRKKGE